MYSSKIIFLCLHYGYPIIFLLVLIEGPIVTITSSFFAASGYFNVFILYPVIVIADLSSDILWYFVGYFGREKIINRWGNLIGLNTERVDKFEKINDKFKKHRGKVLIIAKITHVIGLPFLISAGIFKWDLKKFIWFNFLATLPKTLFFIILGYYFGEAHEAISKYLGYSTLIGITAFSLSLIIYFVVVKLSKKLFKNYIE
jgi:membrane protein DedA with SNARE-associated domain